MHRIQIQVTGETGIGKSIILAIIERAIKEAGIRMVLSPDLEAERKLNDPDNPPEWEMESLKNNTYVYLDEVNISGSNNI
jgi:hypothetical protein